MALALYTPIWMSWFETDFHLRLFSEPLIRISNIFQAILENQLIDPIYWLIKFFLNRRFYCVIAVKNLQGFQNLEGFVIYIQLWCIHSFLIDSVWNIFQAILENLLIDPIYWLIKFFLNRSFYCVIQLWCIHSFLIDSVWNIFQAILENLLIDPIYWLTDAFGWYFQKNNFTWVGPTFISPVAGSLHVWNDLSKIVHIDFQKKESPCFSLAEPS
jgi:hypothetical protein